MAVAARVTVASTPTVIEAVEGTINIKAERAIVVRNKGSVSVDLGGATVATGSGFELGAGESVSFNLPDGDTLYGVTASGTCRVDVLSVGP